MIGKVKNAKIEFLSSGFSSLDIMQKQSTKRLSNIFYYKVIE